MQRDFICIDFSMYSQLVNPDNTLTLQGEHVKGCIQKGAVLAGTAILLVFPPNAILSTLPMIAQQERAYPFQLITISSALLWLLSYVPFKT